MHGNRELERQLRELKEQNQERVEDIAVLRADMKTNYAETESALDRLRADIARRDKDNLRWTVGFGIAQIAITIAVLAAGFAFLALVGIPAK